MTLSVLPPAASFSFLLFLSFPASSFSVFFKLRTMHPLFPCFHFPLFPFHLNSYLITSFHSSVFFLFPSHVIFLPMFLVPFWSFSTFASAIHLFFYRCYRLCPCIRSVRVIKGIPTQQFYPWAWHTSTKTSSTDVFAFVN